MDGDYLCSIRYSLLYQLQEEVRVSRDITRGAIDTHVDYIPPFSSSLVYLSCLSPPFTQIKRSFPNDTLPDFPPKKMLTLDAVQLDDRRFGIEKYLQGSE